MRSQDTPPDPDGRDHPVSKRTPARRGRRLILRTITKSWDDGIFSMSAQAAFWQALSLPPLLLGLLGSLGYVTAWFGPQNVLEVERGIIRFSGTIFSQDVVSSIIAPTATDILNQGRADIVSVGFVIALFAGSSAVSSLIDSITFAHAQYDVRHPVWQRIFALLTYLFALVVAVLTLPLVAIGPDLLPRVLPDAWLPVATHLIGIFYYPVVGLVLAVGLTTLYKVALPRSLPWRRLLPGALLAMVVFFVSAAGLRFYIATITGAGYTYGALATPIAFLLFAFLIGFATVLGAQLNNAIQEVWPVRPSRRQRRIQRLLGLRQITEQLGVDRDAAPAPTPEPPGGQPDDAMRENGRAALPSTRETPTSSGHDR